ncbi:MAG: prepilin-type N-terminal cleavage/methylation domain-containing protein [Candidatus Eiseniibacteriota bacterium]|nr:MAG: prepilin-type N-terminal cleavage/methylation domain-containing protein [Candidatus Eisenbacteria bacterium]
MKELGTVSATTTHRAQAGFSLVELLVALVFLGIGIMAVAALFPLATKNVNEGKVLTTALGQAQEKLEELQEASYSSALMAPGAYRDSSGHYVRSWTVRDSLPVVGSKRVTVWVSWPAAQGRDSVSLATYISK